MSTIEETISERLGRTRQSYENVLSEMFERDRILMGLTVGPAALLMLFAAFVPVVWALNLSLHEASALDPTWTWIGIENYRGILNSSQYWEAFNRSLVFGFGSVALQSKDLETPKAGRPEPILRTDRDLARAIGNPELARPLPFRAGRSQVGARSVEDPDVVRLHAGDVNPTGHIERQVGDPAEKVGCFPVHLTDPQVDRALETRCVRDSIRVVGRPARRQPEQDTQ
jgi:hypothetical protein